MNKEDWLQMCKIYPRIILELLKKILTPELCKEAVKGNGAALEYVPQKYRTKDFAIDFFSSLNIINRKQKNYSMRYEEIKNLEQMKELLYKEVADIAAEWWLS